LHNLQKCFNMPVKKTKEPKPAHRPLKYGEETVMFRQRVPISKLEKIKALVLKELKKSEV
jgi:hypothetical protein